MSTLPCTRVQSGMFGCSSLRNYTLIQQQRSQLIADMTTYSTRDKHKHKQVPASTEPALFICILFMLIILLPWIHPVTDQHPTRIASNISHCLMATALLPYSRLVTCAVFIARLHARQYPDINPVKISFRVRRV